MAGEGGRVQWTEATATGEGSWKKVEIGNVGVVVGSGSSKKGELRGKGNSEKSGTRESPLFYGVLTQFSFLMRHFYLYRISRLNTQKGNMK